MREILFRGKRLDTGEWVYWTGLGRFTVTQCGRLISGKEGLTDWAYELLTVPATVCQFTGETDRNGKKIFEGDTVICSLPSANYNPPHSWNRKQIVFERGAFWAEDRAGERVPLTDYVTSVEIEVVQDETKIL